MSSGVEGPQFTPHTSQRFSEAKHVHRSEGSYQGQKVVAAGGQDLQSLMDAAEELTFTRSESASKKLAERTAKNRAGKSSMLSVMQKYVHSTPEGSQLEKFHQWADSLRKRSKANPPTPEEIERKLKEFFGGDAEAQVTGLEFLEEALASEDNKALTTALRQIRDTWREDETHGPAVRAGENIQNIADQFADESFALDPELRTFYRDVALGNEPLEKTYDLIIKRYGADHFDKAIDYLLQALGSDISSPMASREQSFLVAVRDDILHMQVVRGLHQDVDKLVTKMQQQFDWEPPK